MNNKKEYMGGVKRIDDLGRIVIPKDIRYALGIAAEDQLEIMSDGKEIILRKYNPKTDTDRALQAAMWQVRNDEDLDESVRQSVLQKLKEAQSALQK